ncbi:MBL fold metallo-hydrolase, partial [Acidobacteria bacterium AH-259-L09]|nr:MBL fold metallo-hydrolase [Acidobacteria bacterium AH-259-L09]
IKGVTMHHHHTNPTHNTHPTRRDFLRTLLGTGLAGVTVLEVSFFRAVLARAQSPGAGNNLFDIHKVVEGVYCAVAKPAAMINCNAAIFENANDVLVVDTHSKPSAAAALIAQIRKEVTQKPVRYIVNTHFHWDHAQGNSAYRKAFSKLDILASEPTKRLMVRETESRVKAQLEQIPEMVSQAEQNKDKAKSAAEKAFYDEEIRQLKAYELEMKNFSLELPTITFEDSYVIKDKAHDLHLSFHGRGHTAGDVVVLCPQKGMVATGDLIHGFFPYIGDGYPREWPGTIDAVAGLEFDRILPGHGPVHADRSRMAHMRNYIEELTERVARGKRAGKDVGELQKTITVSSLESLAAHGYGDYLAENIVQFRHYFGTHVELQESVNTNIEHIYQNL